MIKVIEICKKTLQAIKYSIKNWKSDWGNLIIFLITISSSIYGIGQLLWKIIPYTWLRGFLMICFVILTLVGWVHSTLNKISINKLQKELEKTKRDLYEEQDNKNIIENNMHAIPQKIIEDLLDYWDFDYNERITIYRDDNDGFIPVGRASKNPEYKNINRGKYPKNVGYINLAWKSGSFYKYGLPDPGQDKQIYLNKVKEETGMNKKQLEEISMFSRSYYCRNLPYDNPVAMIVIESLKPELPWSKQQLENDMHIIIESILIRTLEPNLHLG